MICDHPQEETIGNQFLAQVMTQEVESQFYDLRGVAKTRWPIGRVLSELRPTATRSCNLIL